MKEDPRLEQILSQIIRLANEDFSVPGIVSEKGDELDAIIAGMNLLGEELGAKSKFISGNQEKINLIMEALIRSTQLDFSQKMEITEKGDEYDAIALGLNTMSEELESHIQQLQNSQEKIKNALLQLTEAQHLAKIGSWEWDIPNQVISWSQELYRIYGRKKEDFESTFENYLLCIHPSDRAFVNGIIQKAYSEQKAFNFAHRIVHPNGEERFLDCKGEVYCNSEGVLMRMTGTAQDVTEMKTAESKISKLAAIVESSGDAIISKTLEGIITSWNSKAEKLFGYSADEIIGKHISLLFPDYKLPEEEMIISQILEGKQIVSYETERKKKDETIFNVSVTISPIMDSHGQVIGISKIARDITEKKLAEQRLVHYTKMLERKNKETEQFAYIASHDLQEPLRTITNYIGLFKTEHNSELNQEAETYLNFIYGASERMKILIRDLLEYTRIENLQDCVEIDCNKLMGEIVKDMDASISQCNASITYDSLPVIKGFESRIRSLFQNLISNAIKFRKPDVPVEVNIFWKDQGEEFLFGIKDNGIGIEEIYKEKIFLLFQRLHSRSEYQGTGIGLAHCKKIVELRGGRIWVESKLGIGSTFYFSLPKLMPQ